MRNFFFLLKMASLPIIHNSHKLFHLTQPSHVCLLCSPAHFWRHSQTLPHHASIHEQRHRDSCIRFKTEGTFHPSACPSGLNERASYTHTQKKNRPARLLLLCVCVSFNTGNFFSNSSNIYILLPGQHCSYHSHPWNSNTFPQPVLVFTISATILLEKPHRYWDFSPCYFHFRKIKGQHTVRAAFQKLSIKGF